MCWSAFLLFMIHFCLVNGMNPLSMGYKNNICKARSCYTYVSNMCDEMILQDLYAMSGLQKQRMVVYLSSGVCFTVARSLYGKKSLYRVQEMGFSLGNIFNPILITLCYYITYALYEFTEDS
eukprot:Gb_20113 [translate_table: standard]